MHPLLQRQIDRTLGDEPRSPAIEALLDRVARAYEQADADRAMLERALDLSSHELVDANRGLRQAVDLLETTLESTEDGLLVVDPEGRVVRTNERFLSVWELTQDDLSEDAGALMSVLSERLVLTGDLAALLRDAQEHPDGSFSAVLSLKGDRFLQVGSRPQKQGREEGGGRVWSFHDLTEIKRAESTIRHFAYHDPLTDLPNRALLNDRLSIAMARARRANTSLGLFFIDLDHFKHINDSLGHGAGDRVLVQVATRLERVRRSCDTLARFGGDEFVLVVQDLGGRADFELVARRILEALNRPFEVEGHALHVSASVGVALFPEDALDEETLIRKADTALYAAKDMGRDTFEVFTGEQESVNLERILLQNALRAAVEDDRFYIEIQPIVCGTTGRILAGEALCRWTHRDRRISPVTFIPMAEEAGIIDQLGLSVLRQGLEQCAAWRAAGHNEVRLSINVSPLQLHRPDFIRRMCTLLEDEDLPRSILQVELTESTLIEGGERGIEAVRHLAAAGFSVALDDFGTGYSSLGNLRRLPLTALKIDRTFVQSCGADARDAEFVRTIVSLGHSLDLQVIAEGVETVEQYRVLAQAGCDALQGFGLARPLPAAEFLGRLEEPSLLTPLVGSAPV